MGSMHIPMIAPFFPPPYTPRDDYLRDKERIRAMITEHTPSCRRVPPKKDDFWARNFREKVDRTDPAN